LAALGALWRAFSAACLGTVSLGCQRAVDTFLSLETDALLDGALSRESSHRLWCMSVMAVREKCDEKGGRQITSGWQQAKWGAALLTAVFGKRVV